MNQIKRISASDTKSRLSTHGSLLICIYDDDKFKQVHLEGAIAYSEFEIRLPDLSMDQEIIFY